MELELRHLKVVCAVAESGSVTRAASALGLAQPALTAQLKRIERMLGGALFERDQRGARATALGELVLARARLLLPAVEDLQLEAARFAQTDDEGTAPRYRLGSTAGPILGGLVDQLATAHPEATITTYASASPGELAELALSGRLDFVMAGVCDDCPPPAGNELSWQTVAMDAMVLLLPDQHPLVYQDEVELAQLSDARWAVADGGSQLASRFTASCARCGFTPAAIYETDVSSCVDLVQVGQAVGLCQPTLPPVPGLTMAPIAGTPLRLRQVLGWNPHHTAARLADRVIEYAGRAYAEAVRRSTPYAQWLRHRPELGLHPYRSDMG